MGYPKTGNEVYVSFSLSNTMFSGIGKGTITRELVSVDYLKDLFQKYGEGAAHQLYGRDAERDGGPDQPGGRRQLRHGGPGYQPAHGL